MNPSASSFIVRVDDILAKHGVRSVKCAVEAGHVGMPREASLSEQARIIVCLEGTAGFQLKQGDHVAEIALLPGEGLFVAPGRWVRARPREPYISMGVVFYQSSTRFYLMRGKASRDRHPGYPVEMCIAPAGLDEDARALVRLLERPPAVPSPERFLRNAFECLLMAARFLLAGPSLEPEAGKARFTWQSACSFMAENLHRPLDRREVARHLRVHPNHLSRLFSEFGREPFSTHLQNQRLERARLLLADPRLNITEVARLSGFTSANYFIRVFRQHTGHTPTRARQIAK